MPFYNNPRGIKIFTEGLLLTGLTIGALTAAANPTTATVGTVTATVTRNPETVLRAKVATREVWSQPLTANPAATPDDPTPTTPSVPVATPIAAPEAPKLPPWFIPFTPKIPTISKKITLPATPKNLPTEMDTTDYIPQRSCEPTPRKGTVAFRKLILTTTKAGFDGGISRDCQLSWSTRASSEHKDGRAWDWMVNRNNKKDTRAANTVTAWLTADNGANAKRIGVMYIIWNNQIWGAYDTEHGWRDYETCATNTKKAGKQMDTACHRDHVHFSLTWDGANERTSWWSGKHITENDQGACRVRDGNPAPLYGGKTLLCPPPEAAVKGGKPVLQLGTDSSVVKEARGLLKKSGYKPGKGTRFGPVMRKSVIKYQRDHKLKITGAVDDFTWVVLLNEHTVREGKAAAEVKRHEKAKKVDPEPVTSSTPSATPNATQLVTETPTTTIPTPETTSTSAPVNPTQPNAPAP